MVWARIDDGFARHPKIAGLSDKAFRLHVAALCDCSRYLTDGRISRESVANLAGIISSRKVFVYANQLVSAGLWSSESGGFAIHDYLVYNPAKQDIERKKAATRARMRAIRASAQETECAREHDSDVRANSRARVPSPSKPKNPRAAAEDSSTLQEAKLATSREAEQQDPAAAEDGDEPAPLPEVVAVVQSLKSYDLGTLREVEPLALELPAERFRDVVARLHKRRNVQNDAGLLVHLLQREVREVKRLSFDAAAVEAALGELESPIERRRREDPVGYLEAMADVLSDAEVTAYLDGYVTSDQHQAMWEIVRSYREAAEQM